MPAEIVSRDDTYILNYCTKYLARDNSDPRHNFGQFSATDLRARISECWRYPLVDSFFDGRDQAASYAKNLVTFVYFDPRVAIPQSVAVIGSFANLYDPIPLRRIAETPYFVLSLAVPKGQVHTYKYLVDGEAVLDPVNPQQATIENGKSWSRFFTQLCTQLVSFERWEADLLERLTDHILPFRTSDGQNFVRRFYDSLDRQSKETRFASAYRLDQSVGVVNYIDKVVAREENHHLGDYKVCLKLVDRVLRQRNPYTEPSQIPKPLYEELYNQMASNSVNGWDYGQYGSPRYFLQLLRRHTYTGAFSHPKYGGNVGALGWAYLEDTYRDDKGNTLFNWRQATEAPLGANADYRG